AGRCGGSDRDPPPAETYLAPIVALVPDEDDEAVARREAPMLDDPEVGLGRAAPGCCAPHGHELRGVDDRQIRVDHRETSGTAPPSRARPAGSGTGFSGPLRRAAS